MDIYSKKVKRFVINTIYDLEKFIKDYNVKLHFLSFNKQFYQSIQEKINITSKINIKKLKCEFIKEFFNDTGPNNINYWLNRGYDLISAQQKLSENQSKGGIAASLNWKNNREYAKTTNSTFVEYWIKKGFTEEEAKIKRSERQKTFSLDKCIQKYGNDLGEIKFEERQKKWQLSLTSRLDFAEIKKKQLEGLKKTPNKLKVYIQNYGEFEGKRLYAHRNWGIDIKKLEDFDIHFKFLHRERTILFYDKDFRYKILNDQNFYCGNPKCNISNKDAQFHLHHIDFDKSNDNRLNLIFLCHSCHSKTSNSNNKYIEYYKMINEEICNETKI